MSTCIEVPAELIVLAAKVEDRKNEAVERLLKKLTSRQLEVTVRSCEKSRREDEKQHGHL